MRDSDCFCPRCSGQPPERNEVREQEYGEAALIQDIAERIVELYLKDDPTLLSSMTQNGEAMSDEAAITELHGEAVVKVQETLALIDTDIMSALVWLGRDVDRLVHELAAASAADDNADDGADEFPF